MRLSVKTAAGAAAVAVTTLGLCGTASANGGIKPVCERQPPRCQQVPEIDPGSAASAFTLLVGGVLSLVDKSRRG